MKTNLRNIFLILFVIGAIFSQTAFAEDAIRLDKENGPLENIQVILLFLSSIAFLLPVAKAERSYRCVLLGGAMLSFSFILRELDVEDLAGPQWVAAMGSGTGRGILLGAGWAIVGFLSIKSFAVLEENLKPIIFSRTTLLLFIAGLILFSGSFFDHKDDKTPADQLAEELIEVVGYSLFFIGSIISRFTARSLVETAGESVNG